MPFIRVTSFPLDKGKRGQVASEITEVMLKHIPGMPREVVWVVFEPMPPDSWAIGGTLASDMKK